jgi:hypothetical protein
MFALNCFLFFVRQHAHHATASRQSYREYCLFDSFFKNYSSMLLIFAVVDFQCARCRWYKFIRKTSVDLTVHCFILSLSLSLYSFLSVYNTHRSPIKLTKRHLFSFSLLSLPVCAFLFLHIFYPFFNVNFSPLSCSVCLL